VHETGRRLITRMIEDVIAESRRRLLALEPGSPADLRQAAAPVIAFSPAMEKADAAIKEFLTPRMYRHARIERVMAEAEGVLRDLVAHYMATPADLPPEWAEGFDRAGESMRARRIADYIAGMTDRYALIEHAKYFKTTPELR
jgi:dGTPase